MPTTSHVAPEIVSAGIDWITATFKPDYPDVRLLDGLVHAQQQIEAKNGAELKLQSPQGYVGTSSGNLFWGARPDGYMLRCSGDLCNTFYKELCCVNPEWKTTRLDLQVSAPYFEGLRNFAPKMSARVRKMEACSKKSKPVTIGTVQKASCGDSVTFYSRTSECFIRIYDKTAEQRGRIAPNILRYEAELKEGLARNAWRDISNGAKPRDYAAGVLRDRLTRLGLDESWFGNTVAVTIPTSYRCTDDERRLEWLASHVRATIDRLREHGLEAEAKKALGL